MLNLAVPWWELVIRSIIVFVVLLMLLRLTGKRQVGQLAPNDLVLLLILANAVQNSMNAGDNSLIGGLISAVTLIVLNFITDDEFIDALDLSEAICPLVFEGLER